MSSTPVEQRVNMSLEDITKANKAKTAASKKKAVPKTTKGGKKTAISKPKVAANATGKPKIGGKKKAAAAGPTTKTALNQAKAVGKTKANRTAQINQKRGLSATANATPKQIKAMTKKQLVINKKLAPSKKKPIANASLKISFNTAQVRQNTDKNMVAQLMGALSKGGGAGTVRTTTKPKPKQPPIIKQPFRR